MRKRILKIDIGPLAGLSAKECRATRSLIAFAARGPRGSGEWWNTAFEFETAAKESKRFTQIDPATIALIVEIIMAMLEQKQ